KGLIPREYGRWLTEALDIRLSGTYNIYAVFGEDIVKEIIEKAEKFVNKIEDFKSSSNTSFTHFLSSSKLVSSLNSCPFLHLNVLLNTPL
ncbi:MAG: hypothetical protein DRO65_02780, partial [Candidatus Altiarchaeales archaeon]